MRKLRNAFWVCSSMLISSGYASELDDCVLNGLRGVNSDVAARMVKQACESKIGGRQNAELVEKYGAPISADLEVESWDTAWKSSTLNVIANLRNNSSQTVLYVVLGVATPNNNDTCPYSWEYKRKFLYRVRLKPDSVGAFVIPDGGSYRKKVGGGICLQGTAVRGRAARFIDVDLGSYEPLPDKEVSSVNAKLNTSYAVPPPEPAAPSSINYFELLKIAPDLNPNSKSRSGK